MKTHRASRTALAGLGLGLAVVSSASPAAATTFFLDVTTFSSPDNVHCGIGDAVAAVNNQAPVKGCPAGNGDFDLILLGPNQTFDISPGLDIRAPIAIVGDGPGVRLFSNGSRTPAITVTTCDVLLQDLTVFGANLVQATQGIRLTGVSNPICVNDNHLTVSFARVTGFTNSGILVNDGLLGIFYSTIDGNVTSSSQNGGGLTSVGIGSETQITNSTFANNQAPNGGAIRVRGGYVKVWYSTLANNRATNGNGGGGYCRVESGETFSELDFLHSTIARNSASGQGGGVFNHSTANGETRINASIIALNTTGRNNTLDDLRGVIRSPTLLSHDGRNKNLFSALPNNPRPPGFDSSLDIINTNPRIGNLSSSNGGPTATIALQSGSPAINAGLNSNVPNDPSGQHSFDLQFTTDQRGFPAPNPSNGAHDLGSYER